jgi:hypothetical protein
MSSIIKVDTIQNQSGANIISESSNTITVGASGDTISVPSGATINLSNATQSGVGGINTPAWSVSISANQSISANAYTKVQFDREEVDTDNAFDNSSNYRFTVPSGKGGKYFVASSVRNTSSNDFDSFYLNIKKNGSDYVFSSVRNEFRESVVTSCLINLSAGDYLEVFAYNGDNGSIDLSGSSDKPSGTHFSGYRIIE